MLPVLALATLALAAPAPITVNFTSDSVYKNESIITPKEVIEQEDGLYTIVLEEDKLLGYCIYDNKDTAYIDGLKFDDQFVTNYIVKDVDLELEHSILVKTTYTDDIAGMLAAAKDGDWSRILANPLIIIQIGYYLLAAISLIVGGIGVFKARVKKVKDHNQIANSVDKHANDAAEALKVEAINLVTGIVTPVFDKLRTQNQAIIEALVLAQSGDKDSKLALINLLKNTATEDVTLVTDGITKAIESSTALKEKAKKEADKVVKEIASGNFIDNSNNGTGGISI